MWFTHPKDWTIVEQVTERNSDYQLKNIDNLWEVSVLISQSMKNANHIMRFKGNRNDVDVSIALV